ncbi:M20/M25/M40 family metallo-hydrolase [Thalassobaculum sp.]|uniref:M20/M25/M40 family metallo-hydrolase n=1 Tax=Thalassobaculum sp. TaxID=2022740 RepID=UPI0032ED3EC5
MPDTRPSDAFVSPVAAAVDARWDAEIAFLRALVRQPSDNPPGDCAAHAEVAAGLLEGLGLTVERHKVPDDVVRAAGMVSCTNLVVRKSFGDGPTVALNAHGDVVPPGDGWTHDPYGGEVVDGVMYGRGVAVSKSDFATYAFALLALEPVAEKLSGTVELHFTYDEETGGGIGPAWILGQGISRPDLAISAGFSHAIVTAHNGVVHLAVTLRGRSAHAAKPDEGADAIEAMAAVLQALYVERRAYPERVSAIPGIGHPNLTVGLIEGGINTNVVPDRCTIRLDRRMTPEEDPAAVEARLRTVIAGAVAGHAGIAVEIERVLLASPLRRLVGAEKLIDPVRRHARRLLGEEVPVEGVPLYTDARLYAEAGVPTIGYGAGPRTFLDANGHRADEKLVLKDLRMATEVVALAVAEVLAGI